MKPSTGTSRPRWLGRRATWAFLGFAAIALFFLAAEHRAHLYGWLPYLLLAACPLMHLVHGHHGRHGHGAHPDEPGGEASREREGT